MTRKRIRFFRIVPDDTKMTVGRIFVEVNVQALLVLADQTIVDNPFVVQCIEGIEVPVGCGVLNVSRIETVPYWLKVSPHAHFSTGQKMAKQIIRMVTRAPDGSLYERDLESVDDIGNQYEQVGIDDCSTDLTLRGMPVFRGLIGPIPEGKGVVRYESPDVFEAMTKEWTQKKTKRRRRKPSVPAPLGLPMGESAPASTIVPGEFA